MASGFFAILDDIATLMDDVASMTKIATRKTAGILGDDLAVNAEKAAGFTSSREIPVLWAISKGSFVNKLIILPIAFLLSSFLPWAVTVILLIGGIYLAFEGAEKVYHFFVPHHHSKKEAIKETRTKEEILQVEKERIKSAIVTDFILSVEIVIIALGAVTGEPLVNQIIIVTFIAILATVGVYGIVALIVRMDETGYKIMAKSKKKSGLVFNIGQGLVNALPIVIKALGIIGTLALLLVAGGIFTHNIDYLHHFAPAVPSMLKDFVIGLIVGFIALLIFKGVKKLLGK
ncbi:DUF808 domain-containing protein [Echinicola strongylocentroti]|uniref:DUF808 domain-containing protein n=1 Tax=Echinicola strongylocentroti TaxID=1795355 RepID=A0A2Z4IEJ9_9BACT|nr:DUF808 domain-containing protein [Echinicola strongylocentroti]AWW29086.1 DUF808 domain-containing protein [Echinicola strongylocentroti]